MKTRDVEFWISVRLVPISGSRKLSISNFQFLSAERKDLHEAAKKAEQMASPDARTACLYARFAFELAVAWACKFDRALTLPYQVNISALIHEPTFKQSAGEAVSAKAKVIVTQGTS